MIPSLDEKPFLFAVLSVTNDHQLAALLLKMADARTCFSYNQHIQQHVSTSRERVVRHLSREECSSPAFVVPGEAGSDPLAHACCLAIVAALPHKKSTGSHLMA
jgi:hypothetical protein